MKDNTGFFKRLLAYCIDMFIISGIASLLYLGIDAVFKFDASLTEKYNDASVELSDKLTNEEITEEEYLEEFLKLSSDSYQGMTQETVPLMLTEFIVIVLYMIVLPYYNNGQTYGKKFLNIKIVDKKGKTPSLNTLALRGIINYSLYVTVIELLFVFILKKGYFELSIILEAISMCVILISMIMIVFNSDKRGIHDHISGTKVISDYDNIDTNIIEK